MLVSNLGKDDVQLSNDNEAARTTLHNNDCEYGQTVFIGKPEQELFAWVTTYSSMLWVPHITCDEAACGHLKFNPLDSSSFIQLKGQSFTSNSLGRGVVKGELGQDIVKIGGNGEDLLLVPQLTFGIATSVNDTAFDENLNGLLGLSPAEYLGTRSEPFIRSAIRQGSLKQPLFTVFLHPDPVQYGHPAGSITYGLVDSVNCGPIISYEKIFEGGYQFEMSGVFLGEFNYRIKSLAEINFDAMITAPSDVIAAVAKIANASYSRAATVYPIDCNARFPDLRIAVGASVSEAVYGIKYSNLIIKVSKDKCILAMKPVEKTTINSKFAFGVPFMRQYCTIFDIGQQRLGFADALTKPRTTGSTSNWTTGTTTPQRRTTISTTDPSSTTVTSAAYNVISALTLSLLINVLGTVRNIQMQAYLQSSL